MNYGLFFDEMLSSNWILLEKLTLAFEFIEDVSFTYSWASSLPYSDCCLYYYSGFIYYECYSSFGAAS